MSVIGVDFGNKNAVVAAAGRGGVDVVLNGNSNRLNSCMVGFGNCRSMGESAQSTATSNFRNTITNMKRLVGLEFDDPRAQAEMKRTPYTCVRVKHGSGPDTIGVKVNFNSEEKIIGIEAVAGMMVKHMGSIVASKTAESTSTDVSSLSLTDVNNPLFPRDWVVTIPGYYTDAQKRAFLAGCEIAGLKGIQRLMHENTATALAYGIFKDIRKEFTKDNPANVMFIDLGASSYSCSIVAFEPGKLIMKTAQYDPDLGGRDFDQVVAEWIAHKFEEKYKGKLSARPMEKPKVVLKLLAAAEKGKKTLSPAGVREARIGLECLMDDFDFNVVLKAAEYEEICAPLLARLSGPVERALAETKLQASDLTSIEIVGGGTRVGCVKRKLAEILGLDKNATNNGLSTTMNADEAIARGAALQSAILSPRFKVLPYEIVEFQPFPVKVSWEGDVSNAEEEGMEIDGKTSESDIPTNSVIMFNRGSNFNSVRRVTLRRPGKFEVKASYDSASPESQFPEGVANDIATFIIKAPEGPENKIRVNIKQDINGIILLSSAQMVEEVMEEEPTESETEMKDGEENKKEESSEKKKKVKKTNLECSERHSIEWFKKTIEKAHEEEVAMSNVDRLVKETSDKRNELESYLYDMRDKIISDYHLAPYGTESEKSSFSALLETTENWLYEDGFDAKKSVYAEKLEELKKIGNPIEFRQKEAAGRSNALDTLKSSVEKYNNWLNSSSGNDEFSHISYDEFTKCHDKCDEVSAWMYEKMEAQGNKELFEDPAFTIADVNGKHKELSSILNMTMSKPKPKSMPKKEESAKTQSADAPQGDKSSEGDQSGGEAMETDEKEPEKSSDSMDVE